MKNVVVLPQMHSELTAISQRQIAKLIKCKKKENFHQMQTIPLNNNKIILLPEYLILKQTTMQKVVLFFFSDSVIYI